MTNRRLWVPCLLLVGACNVYPETPPDAVLHDLDAGGGADTRTDVSVESDGSAGNDGMAGQGGQAGAAGSAGDSGVAGAAGSGGDSGVAGAAGSAGDSGVAGAAGDSGSTVKLTATLAAGSDDANEEFKSFVADAATVWIGNGKKSSYTGLRFSGVDLPPTAQIVSATVRVYSSVDTSVAMAFEFHAEAADDCATFSSTATLSSRTLATAKVSHASTDPWTANTWYTFDNIATVVQEIVARPGWTSGNHLCVILVGTGSARREVVSRDASATNSAVLEIEYAKP